MRIHLFIRYDEMQKYHNQACSHSSEWNRYICKELIRKVKIVICIAAKICEVKDIQKLTAFSKNINKTLWTPDVSKILGTL